MPGTATILAPVALAPYYAQYLTNYKDKFRASCYKPTVSTVRQPVTILVTIIFFTSRYARVYACVRTCWQRNERRPRVRDASDASRVRKASLAAAERASLRRIRRRHDAR
jgi:hypothetical protein